MQKQFLPNDSCQRVVDAASKLECKRCKALLDPETFAEHVLENDTCELVHTSSREHSEYEQYYYKEEREVLIKKLEETEEALKEMWEKYREIEAELERNKGELEKAKMACAVMDEQRAEAELSLKTEIKFLISKLTKTKTKLAQNVQKTCNSASIENALRQLRSVSTKEFCGFQEPVTPGTNGKTKKGENRYIVEGFHGLETPRYEMMALEKAQRYSNRKELPRNVGGSKVQSGYSCIKDTSGKTVAGANPSTGSMTSAMGYTNNNNNKGRGKHG